MTEADGVTRPRRRRRRLAILSCGLALILAYGTLDAVDVVPGVLTTDPVPPEAQPFPAPDLPGALAAPTVTSADEDLATSPVPEVAQLEALVDAFDDDDRRTGSFGLVVTDALSGEVVVDHDGDRPRSPASSLKILTGAAALAALGPETRLPTTVVRSAEDAITLVGGGDVMLGTADGDEADVSGHAGLGDLATAAADALTADGITEVSLGLDATLFTGPGYHPNWETLDRDFVMAIEPLAVDSGRMTHGYSSEPALDAARAFADALEDAGVVVTGLTRRAAPADADELARVESAPVNALVRHMLRVSDNSLAEALGRLVAIERGEGPDFAGAVAAIRDEVRDLGLDVTELTLSDASGLDSGSAVSPAILVAMLALAAEDPELAGLLPGMPLAGLHGTLSARFSDAGAGSIRAKTGTLPSAISLTGLVLTANERPLYFSVIASGLERGTFGQARLAVDDLVAGIAACGCSG